MSENEQTRSQLRRMKGRMTGHADFGLVLGLAALAVLGGVGALCVGGYYLSRWLLRVVKPQQQSDVEQKG